MSLLDESFGVIVYRLKGNEPEFLVLKHGQGHWSYPKGHRDAGESMLEAALRELREEAGITEVKLLGEQPEFEEEYWFRLKGKLIKKIVKYFVGEVDNDVQVEIDNKEIQEYKWVPYEEALNTLTFENSVNLLKKSLKKIKSFNENEKV